MSARQRPLLAGDRLTLMLTLVPYLIEKGPVSVADAAADFGVSSSEMRRGVEVIAVSGVPGDGGLYLHNDLFDIDCDFYVAGPEAFVATLDAQLAAAGVPKIQRFAEVV